VDPTKFRRLRAKFSRHGDLVLGICAPLLIILKEIGDFHGGDSQHSDFSWGDRVTVYIRR
jgi:hypothetical protein